MVDIEREAKRPGIYLALFTNPEGDSCFSIFQISWLKMKKVTFVNQKPHLVGTLFVTILSSALFTILLQIQHENNFLPISTH